MGTQKPFWKRLVQDLKLHKQFALLLGLGLLFLGVLWVIRTFQQPGQMGIVESLSMEMAVQPPEGAMPVETERITRGPFASAVTYTGSAVAYNDVPVYPRTEGWIVSMLVYPGDRVQQGQLLAQLDTRELTSRVREAQLGKVAETRSYYAALQSMEQANAERERAERAIQASKANLSYWQNEIRRAQTLSREEVITTEEFQREQSQFEAAESGYYQAQAQLRAADKAYRAAAIQADSQQARSQQAAATQRTQEIIRSYTGVTAQKSGVITERLNSPGTLVNPNMPILRLAQIQPIRIQANVAESDLSRIRLGNTVWIRDPKSKQKKPVEAKVTALFPAANLQTRTAIVEAILSNTDEQFIPGDYVVMEVQTGQKENILTVSNRALIQMDQQTAVWVVQEGKASLKYITTGETDGKRTEVVRGLESGDVVIVQGQRDLQSGVAVVSGEFGPEGLKSLPKAVSSNRLAEENGYRIKQSAEHQVISIALTPTPPRVGDNELTIVVSSAHGAVSEKLDAEITTVMPAMPSMLNPKPEIRKTGPGEFKAKVTFTMPGLWQMNLVLKEGHRDVARLQFDTKVPE